MNILIDQIAPVLILIVLNFLYPHRWFFNSLHIITISLGTEIPKAVHWSVAGYVNSLYLTYNGRQCFHRISLYFGIPVAISVLIFDCYATGAVLDWDGAMGLAYVQQLRAYSRSEYYYALGGGRRLNTGRSKCCNGRSCSQGPIWYMRSF
jgi:hypothetical protein